MEPAPPAAAETLPAAAAAQAAATAQAAAAAQAAALLPVHPTMSATSCSDSDWEGWGRQSCLPQPSGRQDAARQVTTAKSRFDPLMRSVQYLQLQVKQLGRSLKRLHSAVQAGSVAETDRIIARQLVDLHKGIFCLSAHTMSATLAMQTSTVQALAAVAGEPISVAEPEAEFGGPEAPGARQLRRTDDRILEIT
jgi:hypothetical protein